VIASAHKGPWIYMLNENTIDEFVPRGSPAKTDHSTQHPQAPIRAVAARFGHNLSAKMP
jgi:hypothetical protein